MAAQNRVNRAKPQAAEPAAAADAPRKLTLEQIRTDGFVGKPVLKTISWSLSGEPVELDVWVRRYSYASTVEELSALADQKSVAAGRIAACICDEHGRAVFTAADVTGESNPERGPLDGNLVYALLVAISEVNSGGKT